MADTSPIAGVLDLLRTNAEELGDLLRSAPPDVLAQRPGPDEWSPLETFAHIRAADRIFAPRYLHTAIRPGVVHPAVDERELAVLIDRAGIELPSSLRDFEQ